MNCCTECFQDAYIKNIILSKSNVGNCDFCAGKNSNIYNIGGEGADLSDAISSVLQLYVTYDHDTSKPLKESLRDDWNIFNLGTESINSLIQNLCPDFINDNNELLIKNTRIPVLFDEEYLREFGVVRGWSWKEFANSIKTENRFHNKMFNTDIFASFLSVVSTTIEANQSFYRARISQDSNGYTEDKMGTPPKGKASSGRINPEGISVLYVASDHKTVLNEVRATAYDYVTIGEFVTKKDLKVVNLSAISKTSPFQYGDDLEKYIVNKIIFEEMALDFAKPLRRTDSSLEYLPTQYIAEFIKSEGYDGVQYDSTLRIGGYNIAIFNPKYLECEKTDTVEVSKISYKVKPELI